MKPFFLYSGIFLFLLVAQNLHLSAEEVKTLEIGSEAPPFSLPGIDGKIYTLKDFEQDKVLTIVFTANHCPTAQAYEERILALYSEFHKRGAGFLLVSSNSPQALCLEEEGYTDLGDSFDEMKLRASEKQYPMPYLYDGDRQEMALAYGPTTTPHVFIFDQSRKLRYCGRIDEMENPYEKALHPDAHNAIEALLEGKSVPVEKTKTFGCSIKWASKVEWRKKLDEEWNLRPVQLKEVGIPEIRNLVANRDKKYRLVNVWATWCGPCIVEFPELVNLQRIYGARKFEFISLSADGLKKKDSVLEFLNSKHAALSNYLYSGSDKYALIEAVNRNWSGALPFTMLIAPDGEVVYTHEGAVDMVELRKAIVQKLGRYFAND